jgi:hypothetical protein
MNEYKNLTLKEINIIFQHQYCMKRANEYLNGYRSSYFEYDVLEDVFEDEILIRYADCPGSLVVTVAKALFKK